MLTDLRRGVWGVLLLCAKGALLGGGRRGGLVCEGPPTTRAPDKLRAAPPIPPGAFPSVDDDSISFFGGARYLSAPPDQVKRKGQLNSGALDKPQETPPTGGDHPGRRTMQRTQRGSTTPADGPCSGHDDGNISARWAGGVHPPNLNKYRQTPCTKTKPLDGRGVPPPAHKIFFFTASTADAAHHIIVHRPFPAVIHLPMPTTAPPQTRPRPTKTSGLRSPRPSPCRGRGGAADFGANPRGARRPPRFPMRYPCRPPSTTHAVHRPPPLHSRLRHLSTPTMTYDLFYCILSFSIMSRWAIIRVCL